MGRDRIGRYVVLRKLGEGGMGSVFLARHAQIARQVAIKVLLPQHLHNKDVVRRFFNEARATAELKHPGLVEIFDFGELEDGGAYLVMEHLEGETLAARIARGPVGPALAAEIGRQLAVAVGAAHARGIVHRDLKPENVFLVADPDLPHKTRVKVLDFGIAKLTRGVATNRTVSRLLLGTPAYMSPEQCRGAAAVDHRTDIYALGCVVFEMACGRLPFAFDNMGDLIAAHISDDPPDPLALRPSIPLALRDSIVRCLSKNPNARFQTATQLAESLAGVAGGSRPNRIDRRHSPGDEDTRVDPQIASRMASEWATEVTTNVYPRATKCSSIATEQSPVPSKTATRNAQDIWQTRLAVLGMIVGAVGLTAVIASASVPSTPPSRIVPTSRALAATPTSDALAASTKVELRIDTIPSGAEVVRGPMIVGTTPLRLTAKPAPGIAALEIRLPGYSKQTVSVATDRDQRVTVRLRPVADDRRLVANREPDGDVN